MRDGRVRAVGFGVAVHLLRFGVIMLGTTVAPLLGISGWFTGLFANVLCALFAAALVTRYGLWRTIGLLTPWRGWAAALLLLVPLSEALSWLIPAGLADRDPGLGWWALTLLLVGFNEELISRGVVLERMRSHFSPISAVAITAALFGLQHLSAFATSNRDWLDIVQNVAVSACYGFALAAFQLRFRWIWPLILIHALADFTTILTRGGLSDAAVLGTLVVFVVFGLLVLRGDRRFENRNSHGPITMRV